MSLPANEWQVIVDGNNITLGSGLLPSLYFPSLGFQIGQGYGGIAFSLVSPTPIQTLPNTYATQMKGSYCIGYFPNAKDVRIPFAPSGSYGGAFGPLFPIALPLGYGNVNPYNLNTSTINVIPASLWNYLYFSYAIVSGNVPTPNINDASIVAQLRSNRNPNGGGFTWQTTWKLGVGLDFNLSVPADSTMIVGLFLDPGVTSSFPMSGGPGGSTWIRSILTLPNLDPIPQPLRRSPCGPRVFKYPGRAKPRYMSYQSTPLDPEDVV